MFYNRLSKKSTRLKFCRKPNILRWDKSTYDFGHSFRNGICKMFGKLAFCSKMSLVQLCLLSLLLLALLLVVVVL